MRPHTPDFAPKPADNSGVFFLSEKSVLIKLLQAEQQLQDNPRLDMRVHLAGHVIEGRKGLRKAREVVRRRALSTLALQAGKHAPLRICVNYYAAPPWTRF